MTDMFKNSSFEKFKKHRPKKKGFLGKLFGKKKKK
jgi:hypothetical protein